MDLFNEILEDYKLFIDTVEDRCTTPEKTRDAINKIIKSLNQFFTDEGLDACTLGVSGGIDSAVVLALLVEAQKQPNSPIKVIRPVSLPFENGVLGATAQTDAKNYANLVCKALTGHDIQVVDLSGAYNAILTSANVPENEEYAWANGQMLSVMRTPALYHQAALLQKEGYKSIVVGTVNETEYHLGYWGKASDMMVDLQPIRYLLKFEVYNIAKELGVPQEIIERTPQGDVCTGETDSEMIGAPYELLDPFIHDFSIQNEEESMPYEKYASILKTVFSKQINRNAHKFKVGNPCRFLGW